MRSIAQQSYGDEGFWYRIAETNGLSGDRDLRVGQTINIPSVVGTVRNNASTYKPYDPSKITGDTMPNMPSPNSGGGCGGIGMLLVVVVAVVVTVFTAGAAAMAMAGTLSAATSAGAIMTAGAAAMSAGTLAGVAAAAVGAAVGSIVSQGVAMAIGMQEQFSWKQVGLSAIGGAVSSGLGPASGFYGGPTVSVVLKAATSNAITQGIGVATGLQDKFNWKGVAASAAAAFVAKSLSDTVLGSKVADATAPGGFSRTGGLVDAWGGGEIAKIAGSTVLGIAAGATASLVRGGRVVVQQVATDAFGNALADSIVAKLQSIGEPTLVERADRSQASNATLLALADKYGGLKNVPADLPQVQEMVKDGLNNSATIARLVKDQVLAAQIGRGAAVSGGSVVSEDLEGSPAAVQVDARLPTTYVEDHSGWNVARLAATTGGVITGLFQSIGDGLIGGAELLYSLNQAQQYVLLQAAGPTLNQAIPGYEGRKQSYENISGIGEAVRQFADAPGRFVSEAAGATFRDIESSLETAEKTRNLSDWFFYGAKVGHAVMDVAGMVEGLYGLSKLGVVAAGAAVKTAKAVAISLAPKMGEMLENYMPKIGAIRYIVPATRSMGGATKIGNTADVLDPAASRLAQPGGLMATEGNQVARADGSLATTHPLAKHGPDVTDQYIHDRVATELVKKDGTLRPGSRTAFNDRAQMEDAIAETINLRQNDIDTWLASGPRPGVPEAFTADPGMGNLGRGYQVTTKGGSIVPISQPMPNVNLVLIPDGNGGWLIHTAHPF
ncbi:RNase A-like domain-containing protein [Roseateles sp. YR242]|uniref:RNase A-like domain-containing protein n=1 Tax=Roseateles sp. YR242 TaxID=1855305 RepID=UPI0021012948|nr:RNase A-like domain-containing protein [Roseateles sp. YR242]